MPHDEFSRLVRGLLIPASVAAVFAFSRKYLANRSITEPSNEGIDAAGKAPYVGLATFVCGVCIALISFFALRSLNAFVAHNQGPADRVVLPGNSIWLFFPLFGGLTLAWEVLFRLWCLLGSKGDAEEYRNWSDLKTGFRASSLLRWMIGLFAAPVFVASVLAVPMYADFQRDEVLIGRYAHLSPEHHRYSSVRRFAVVDGIRLRDGTFESRPTLVLGFNDGTEWSSWTLTEDKVLDKELVQLLTKKLKRSPEHQHAD